MHFKVEIVIFSALIIFFNSWLCQKNHCLSHFCFVRLACAILYWFAAPGNQWYESAFFVYLRFLVFSVIQLTDERCYCRTFTLPNTFAMSSFGNWIVFGLYFLQGSFTYHKTGLAKRAKRAKRFSCVCNVWTASLIQIFANYTLYHWKLS